MTTNVQLYKANYALLQKVYERKMVPGALLTTLALMLTGLFLGRHVQLWEMALWAPMPIQLSSIVRRFERFLADPRVKVREWFEPFAWAMHRSLGYECAYLILDCTQVGGQCRTLFVALAYHGSALPLAWQTLKGSKGHVKGDVQKALLQSVAPSLRLYHRLVVLGDSEFSNETLLRWLLTQGWEFVLRFRSSCLVQVTPGGEWQAMKALYQASGLQAGQVQHWPDAMFTQRHRFANLTLTVHWGKEHKEPLCLVSTCTVAELPHQLYEMRYWIETLFGNHKSRAFQLARTHLTEPAQIDRLILVVAIASCMVLGLATHLVQQQQTHWVDRSERRDLSLFQIGFRWFFRLLALNRLHDFRLCFARHLPLAQPGLRNAF